MLFGNLGWFIDAYSLDGGQIFGKRVDFIEVEDVDLIIRVYTGCEVDLGR